MGYKRGKGDSGRRENHSQMKEAEIVDEDLIEKKIKSEPGKVFVIIGDGELNEGSIWESFLCQCISSTITFK